MYVITDKTKWTSCGWPISDFYIGQYILINEQILFHKLICIVLPIISSENW